MSSLVSRTLLMFVKKKSFAELTDFVVYNISKTPQEGKLNRAFNFLKYRVRVQC